MCSFFLCYINFMKNFAVCYNEEFSHCLQVRDKLLKTLESKQISAKVLNINNLEGEYDFVFVIGGDGTILKAARFYAKNKTPVFGINLGRLGFLSQASEDNIELAVNKILSKEFVIQDRFMLKSGNYTALNDFVVKSCDTGRTSKFSLKINNKYICDYLADGIIFSTPTGSTAYGLSAGGPVIFPELDVIEIVPICPHTLTARPIVVPAYEKITVCTDQKCKSIISADGQEFYEFSSKVDIEKSDYTAKLALLKDSEFYSVLREKLHWATHPEYKI